MKQASASPRIAVLSFHLESNAFAVPTAKMDFVRLCWEEGERISELAREVSQLPSEIAGFYAEMDRSGAWTPLPLVVAAAPPGGPVDAATWKAFLDCVTVRLRHAMPVEAVYIGNHGAALGVGQLDTEGVLFEAIRSIVGPHVPLVASYDLHCNISDRAIAQLDALFPYRTNPHVDQRARGADAARAVRLAIAGVDLHVRHVRLPFTPASVTLLTRAGPYADAIGWADALRADHPSAAVVNVAVTGGFVFSDAPHCGMCVVVTVRSDAVLAQSIANELGARIWADRARYVVRTITVAEAVAKARDANAPLLFADVADNPGGGGGGNTVGMIRAFHQATIPGVVMGVFADADAVGQADAIGVGESGRLVFNRTPALFAETFEVEVKVLQASDGQGIGRRGILQGRRFTLGRCALVELAGSGMQVLIGSLRRQLAEPAMLEMHGIDIADIRCLIVKSRGHYRAGFDEYFSDDRIFDVDSDGLTTPNLARVPFRHLPRPVYPIDAGTEWNPSARHG